MKKNGFIALALCFAAVAAHAQESGLSVSAGLKAWSTQWTTFSYDVNAGGQSVVTQVQAKDKVVLIPLLSVRYRDFMGSISGYRPTDYDLSDGSTNSRKELDINLGYYVAPGVALTLGYKKVGQKADTDNYELAGPVVGVSGTAPLGNGFSLYGAFGLGRMKSTGASTVHFDADYRLTEAGGAYTLPTPRFTKALTFTAGYRTQVFTSKQATETQDARDLTQGFTFGLIAAF